MLLIRLELIPSFFSVKRMRVILPLDGTLVHRRLIPNDLLVPILIQLGRLESNVDKVPCPRTQTMRPAWVSNSRPLGWKPESLPHGHTASTDVQVLKVNAFNVHTTEISPVMWHNYFRFSTAHESEPRMSHSENDPSRDACRVPVFMESDAVCVSWLFESSIVRSWNPQRKTASSRRFLHNADPMSILSRLR